MWPSQSNNLFEQFVCLLGEWTSHSKCSYNKTRLCFGDFIEPAILSSSRSLFDFGRRAPTEKVSIRRLAEDS